MELKGNCIHENGKRSGDGLVSLSEKMAIVIGAPDVNCKGVHYGIHSVLPHMLKRQTGHIVNVASVSGFEVRN